MTVKNHRHKLCSALIFIFLITFNAFSQNEQSVISGKVVDEMGNPLEYATIVVKDAENPQDVTGGITTADGSFTVEVPNGTYNILVEFIGFAPEKFENRNITSNTNLGTIALGMAAANLDEVVVTAETTQVEIRLDKKIYTIGQDLTTAGGTVADALNNVPSVSVDFDGAISLRGNENVRILINGKPSAMAGYGNTGVLSQLPADAIERVEVITSPSARYGAEGTAGILNIILKRDQTLGFNGSVTLEGGIPERAGVSTNINFRTQNFNIFNTLGFRYNESPGSSYSNTEYLTYTDEGELVTPRFDRIIEDRDMSRLNRGFYANLGMEYFLNEQSSITASGFLRFGDDEDLTTNLSDRYIGNSLVQSTVRRELETEEDESYQVSLNYINHFNDEGHQLTADIQYDTDSELQMTYINEDLELNELPEVPVFVVEEVQTEETENEFLIQADYVLPIGEESQFEAGIRGNFEENITDYTLQQDNRINDTLSNQFTYNENVSAVYSQYGTKFGDFSFLLGLRLENTQLKGKIDSRLTEEQLQDVYDAEGISIDTDFDNNYLGLFPTLNLIYEIQEDENITLGYNRRINRPRGWFINPFPSRSSRTDIFQGNPNLEPAFSNAFDVGYLKRWDELTLTSSVYYQHETNSFERVEQSTGRETSEGIAITRTIPINLSTNERFGAEAGLLYNPTDWLRLNGSFNFYQFSTDGEYKELDLSHDSNSWFARFSSKVTLPAKVDWQTTAYYRGASEDVQGTRDALASINMAFSKEIFNENATLTLNIQDILNSRKWSSYTATEFFNRESESQWRQRSINLSFTYRFNQQKNEQQKRRNQQDVENDEMQGQEDF